MIAHSEVTRFFMLCIYSIYIARDDSFGGYFDCSGLQCDMRGKKNHEILLSLLRESRSAQGAFRSFKIYNFEYNAFTTKRKCQ